MMNPVQQTLVAFARCWRRLGLAVALTLAGAAPALAQDAVSLLARHVALHGALASNAFQRPLVLESIEHPDSLQGDVYAQIELPFALVSPALQGVEAWCDILILHLNVKQCQAGGNQAGAKLGLAVGSKHDQPLADAYRFEFDYRLIAVRPDYLQIAFEADRGPMGTSRYRIVLEVVALADGRSFLHLSYSNAYGAFARLAMQAYLATIGRNKIGFSVVGRKSDGQPQHVGGTRGVAERNAMRYFLAVEAYLGALSLPASLQFETRLANWFSGAERHRAQLHEIERGEYLALKRAQVRPLASGG